MKKFTAIFLFLIYSLANIGMAAELNYCGNDLTSVSVFSDEHESCCFVTQGADNCCSSKQLLIKAETKDHQNKQQESVPVFNTLYVEPIAFIIAEQRKNFTLDKGFTNKTFPVSYGLQVFYCTFRI